MSAEDKSNNQLLKDRKDLEMEYERIKTRIMTLLDRMEDIEEKYKKVYDELNERLGNE